MVRQCVSLVHARASLLTEGGGRLSRLTAQSSSQVQRILIMTCCHLAFNADRLKFCSVRGAIRTLHTLMVAILGGASFSVTVITNV